MLFHLFLAKINETSTFGAEDGDDIVFDAAAGEASDSDNDIDGVSTSNVLRQVWFGVYPCMQLVPASK